MQTRALFFIVLIGACDATAHVSPSPSADAGASDASAPEVDAAAPIDHVEPSSDAAADVSAPEVCAAPQTLGGTQLKTIHWTSPDGLDVAAGLEDTVANRECGVMSDLIDGVHCRPDPELIAGYVNGTPAVGVMLGPPDLAGTTVYYHDGLDYTAVLGEEVLPTPASVYSGGVERPVQPSAVASHVYRIASTLTDVALTLTHPCADAQLRTSLVRGADGSQLVLPDVYDRARPTTLPLLPHDDGTGVTRWLPQDVGPSQGCTVTGVPSPYFTTLPAGTSEALYQGRPYTLTTQSVLSNCGYEAPPNPLTIYFLGAPIPVNAFEVATPATLGGSRLKLDVPIVDGASLIARPTLHDTTLDVDCQPDLAADGTTRCLPPSPHVPSDGNPAFVAFADASCTQPVVVAVGSVPKIARRPLSPTGAACAPDAYAVGSAIGDTRTMAIYGSYTDMDGEGPITQWECGSCVNISQVAPYDTTIYEATPVPATTLAPMKIDVR